ncbi:MAG: hypothetical protein Q4A62_03825 [Eikenella sp.]|nr:hypothetical protein [Eikenella sp.]
MHALLLLLLLFVLLLLYSRQLHRQKWHDETDECRFFSQAYKPDAEKKHPNA